MSDDPVDAVAAVVHPDPYPYYARLVARGGIARDETLDTWVAAAAVDVEAVLASPLCGVRPPAERVPHAIADTPAGSIYGRFARMSDGAEHVSRRHLAVEMIDAFAPARVAAVSAMHADALATTLPFEEFAFELPVRVVGDLMGLPGQRLPDVAARTRDLVASFAAEGKSKAHTRGENAAMGLLDLVAPVTETRPGAINDAVANGIGLLVQSGEATAALIANTLLALATREELRERVRTSEAGLVENVVREVARFDAPVQNTRRWVVTPGDIAGQPMSLGDAILVVLAAANRDPAANPDPDRFDPTRAERKSFTFGFGPHACPGETLATAIAAAAVTALLSARREPRVPAAGVTYRPSINIRMARFA